jgi:GNAT superfamily N-acetyltransferase
MSKYRIEQLEGDASAFARELESALYRHNKELTKEHEEWPILLRIEDDEGTFAGGLTGYVWARWLHVTIFWLRADLRGQGIGSRLLQQAERFAISKGCRDAYLNTYSFQAPALYQRHGYQIVGRLDDYPVGHKYFFLHKRLSPDAT